MKFTLKEGENILLKTASIGVAILGIVSVYTFYRNNIWTPNVEVIDVDFDKQYANLMIGKKPYTLVGDSPYLITNDWGVKFGYTFKPSGQRVYDRIEIIKKGLVWKYIKNVDNQNVEVQTPTVDQKIF